MRDRPGTLRLLTACQALRAVDRAAPPAPTPTHAGRRGATRPHTQRESHDKGAASHDRVKPARRPGRRWRPRRASYGVPLRGRRGAPPRIHFTAQGPRGPGVQKQVPTRTNGALSASSAACFGPALPWVSPRARFNKPIATLCTHTHTHARAHGSLGHTCALPTVRRLS